MSVIEAPAATLAYPCQFDDTAVEGHDAVADIMAHAEDTPEEFARYLRDSSPYPELPYQQVDLSILPFEELFPEQTQPEPVAAEYDLRRDTEYPETSHVDLFAAGPKPQAPSNNASTTSAAPEALFPLVANPDQVDAIVPSVETEIEPTRRGFFAAVKERCGQLPKDKFAKVAAGIGIVAGFTSSAFLIKNGMPGLTEAGPDNLAGMLDGAVEGVRSAELFGGISDAIATTAAAGLGIYATRARGKHVAQFKDTPVTEVSFVAAEAPSKRERLIAPIGIALTETALTVLAAKGWGHHESSVTDKLAVAGDALIGVSLAAAHSRAIGRRAMNAFRKNKRIDETVPFDSMFRDVVVSEPQLSEFDHSIRRFFGVEESLPEPLPILLT